MLAVNDDAREKMKKGIASWGHCHVVDEAHLLSVGYASQMALQTDRPTSWQTGNHWPASCSTEWMYQPAMESTLSWTHEYCSWYVSYILIRWQDYCQRGKLWVHFVTFVWKASCVFLLTETDGSWRHDGRGTPRNKWEVGNAAVCHSHFWT